MGEIRNAWREPRPNPFHLERKAERIVFVLQGSGKTSQQGNGCGWGTDICFTLNATDVHGVAYGIHST